jgi:hypothetical protein
MSVFIQVVRLLPFLATDLELFFKEMAEGERIKTRNIFLLTSTPDPYVQTIMPGSLYSNISSA